MRRHTAHRKPRGSTVYNVRSQAWAKREIGKSVHVQVSKMELSETKAAEGTAFSRNGLKHTEEPALGKKENSCVEDYKHQG